LNILAFTPNKAAEPVHKLIKSAIANAEENFGVARDDLYVYQIYADEAPTRKWRRFAPAVVLNRYCGGAHISRLF
jgi:large subunit ribosomal protein L22